MRISFPPRLADLCGGIVRVGCGLERFAEADAEHIALECERVLGRFAERAERAGIPADRRRAAEYALCAWLDERILSSALPAKRRWADHPLQLRRFDDLCAGDEFFSRLMALLGGGDAGTGEVLEVYALCLALGFQGGLSDARGSERRRTLLDEIVMRLRAPPTAQAPQAAGRTEPRGLEASTSALIGIAASLAMVVIAVLVARAWVGGAVEDLASSAAEVAHEP
jgi:type VI secretion system protein ImpK